MSRRILVAMVIPAFLFLMFLPSVDGTASNGGKTLAAAEYFTYDFLQREPNKCSISGTFTLTITSIEGTYISTSFSGQGVVSFPGGTDANTVSVGYYTHADSLELDRIKKDLSSAARTEHNTTEFSFSCNASVIKVDTSDEKHPDWTVSLGSETIIGIAFHRDIATGGVNFTSFETLIESARTHLHIDPKSPPDDIKLMEYGFDLEYFGSPNKHYSQLNADVRSYTHDDVFWMDYCTGNGILLYYGYNDLFIESSSPTFYYRIIETNAELTVSQDSSNDMESSVDRYLPGIFSLALLLALGIEVFSGRLGTMENRKKGIFVLFILLFAGSLLSVQFLVIRDEHRVVPTEREIFDRKYGLEVIGLEYNITKDAPEYMAEVNITMRNTGPKNFEERSLEIVFSAEKYGIETFTSHAERADDFTEIANERVLLSGKSVTFFYNIPLGKEDPRWVDLTLRIRVEAATQKGDFLLIEEEIPVDV